MSTWVLLRGLTRDSRHWGDFVPEFCAQVDATQVIALDLPGNGLLNDQRSPASVEAMAAAVRAELRRRGARPPFHVLAMSLGAMVAVAWASVLPTELAGCVLVNTSLRPFSSFHRRLRPRNWAPLLRLMAGGVSDRDWEATVLCLTSRLRIGNAELLDDWERWRHEHPVSRANALRQLWAALRYGAPPMRPAVPMLVLSSAGDGLVDSCCSRALAQQWACDHAEHPGAGHDLPLDDGKWVAQQVRHWLNEQAAGSHPPRPCPPPPPW